MNVQPTLSRPDDRSPVQARIPEQQEPGWRMPGGRAFLGWPAEAEVEPWRP